MGRSAPSASRRLSRIGAASLVLVGCRSFESRLPPELVQAATAASEVDQSWHRGPPVALGETGPARFAAKLHDAFRPKHALELVRFIDGFYRAPANPYYDAVIDRVAYDLRDAGFDGSDPRLRLEFMQIKNAAPAWTPKSAALTLTFPGGASKVLHAFDSPEDVERVMLPIHAPSCDVEGGVALSLDELSEGMILVTDVSIKQVFQRAKARGAAAIVSASLEAFNVDPSGLARHLDALQFKKLGLECATLPVAQISPRSFQVIRESAAAHGSEGPRLRLVAEVEREERPLRTLVATIAGSKRPAEAVVLVSHVQEPGACDNASGVASLAESVHALVGLLKQGELEWPARSMVFLWGDEFRQSETWLAQTDKTTVAAFSSDMTGQAKTTGAIALLERNPDPGAITLLPPDEHTPWGAGEVDPTSLRPNGLAIVARCGLVDVGLIEGGWPSADHPWEGGSDHDVFISHGIPAVLLWHFTDFTYHTSLDRMEFVDCDEMRRTAVALLASGLAVADPRPEDLPRYVKSLEEERRVRFDAAKRAKNDEVLEQWRTWFVDAHAWLEALCEPTGVRKK